MVFWLILISSLQFKSISSNEIIDITENFYSNQSVNIKFAFKATINQSLLTTSFKSELTFSNESDYFIILSNVTNLDTSTKPDCNPIFMGYAFSHSLDNGDVGIKHPYMKYSFQKNEAKHFHDIIPFRLKGERFYLKYFQNRMCKRTKSVLEIFGFFAYATKNSLCPKTNQWMFLLEDNEDKINQNICINQFPAITHKLELFGAIFLNNSKEYLTEPILSSTSDPIFKQFIMENSLIGRSVAAIVITLIIISLILLIQKTVLHSNRENNETIALTGYSRIDFMQQNQIDESFLKMEITIKMSFCECYKELKNRIRQSGLSSQSLEEHISIIDSHLQSAVFPIESQMESNTEHETAIDSLITQNESFITIKTKEAKSLYSVIEDLICNIRRSGSNSQYLEEILGIFELHLQSLKSEVFELIPDTEPVDEIEPVGKFVSQHKILGRVLQLSIDNGGYFQPAKEYAHYIHREWKQMRSGEKVFIWSRPYLIQSEDLKMIVQFALMECDNKQFIIKMKLLDNNYINKRLKLPLILRFSSEIIYPNSERNTHEFKCSKLNEYSNNEFIKFGEYERDDFPQLNIKFLSAHNSN